MIEIGLLPFFFPIDQPDHSQRKVCTISRLELINRHSIVRNFQYLANIQDIASQSI